MTAEEGKTSTKRTTLTIDPDIKLVFEYSLTRFPSKNTSEHLQSLLMTKFRQNDWDKLYREAAEYFRRCRVHDKPYIQICKTCEIAFCEDCDLSEHEGHDIQFYCTKHQFSYKSHCYLCEIESWEKKADIKGITGDELAPEIKINPNIIIVDVRGSIKDQRIINAHHIPYHHFREETEERKQLLELVKENPDAKWITYSQGRIGYPDSMRGWLATLDLKVKYRVKTAFYLKGGFINFVEKYPEFCIQLKSE